MTCQEFADRIAAYAAGALDPAQAAEFEAHLDSCAACERLLLDAEAPLAEAGGLPSAINPPMDLWPAIRGRLPSRSATSRRVMLPRWGLAAAAVFLVALSSGITVWVLNSARHRAETASAAVNAMEAQYAAASEDLGRALEKARARLAPETVATIERNLRIIDAALAESRQALAKEPGNAALEQLVVAVWRQKLDLLRRATAFEPTG